MEIIEYIPIIATVITLVILLFNQNKKGNEDISARVERDTKIATKLDMLILNTNDLKKDVTKTNDEIKEIAKRLTLVEAKADSAHKRIDDFHK